jgi:hypothetical protein
MADYQQAPLVPRTSKQAKMLGVGVDLDSSGQPGRSTQQQDSWNPQGGDRNGRVPPVEVIPPWGNGQDVRSHSLFPFLPQAVGLQLRQNCGQNRNSLLISSSLCPTFLLSQSVGRKKGSLVSSSSSQPLRGARSSSVLRGYGEGKEPVVKEKKRGLFGGLLKRKGSRSDIRDGAFFPFLFRFPTLFRSLDFSPAGYHSDAASVHEPAHPPPASFDQSQLPAKLQARGDAVDPVPRLAPPVSKPAKAVKKSKRPTTPLSGAGRNTPTTRQAAVFSSDPDISLDTNLDSMEGIIAGAPPGPDSAGSDAATIARASISSGSLTRSSSAQAPNGRRPSMAPTSSNSFCESQSPPRPRPARRAPPAHAQASSVAFGSKSADSGSKHLPSQPTAFSKTAPPVPVHMPAPLPFPTSTTSNAIPSRPGMGSRTSSAVSINTFNTVANGEAMRKPSVVGFPTNGAPPPPPGKGAPVVHLPPLGGVMGGAWTAPDSWAVHPEAGASLDHDSSDDDDGDSTDEEHDRETEGSEDGMSPLLESKVKAFGAMDDGGGTGLGLRPGTSGTRSGMARNGRPGTADGEGRKGSQKNVRFLSPFRTLSLSDKLTFASRSSWSESTASTTPSPLCPFLSALPRPK